MHFKTFLDLQEDKEEILEIVSNQITIKEDASENYSREIIKYLTDTVHLLRILKRDCMVKLPSSGFSTYILFTFTTILQEV